MLKFSISAAQETGVIIPAGTRATADGSITFSTVSDIVIPAGEVSGAVKAVCDIPGTVGNGYLAGQIKSCVDIFPYFSAVENLDTTGGGSDRETDSGLYERMRESVEGYSTGRPGWGLHISREICERAHRRCYGDVADCRERGYPRAAERR